MDKEKLRKIVRKTVQINVRITKKDSAYLKKENLSPQKIMDTAMKDLQNE